MTDVIKSYINLIDNKKENVLKKNNYTLKSQGTFSIENCNDEAQKNNQAFFFSGNDLNYKNYYCYIGNKEIPFTTNLEHISGYIYKTTEKDCNKTFRECLQESQNKYFEDKKKGELTKIARVLAYKNSLVYNRNFDELYKKYKLKISEGKEVLEDNDITQRKLVDDLIIMNNKIKKKQLDEINMGDKYIREKQEIINGYKDNLDSIKAKIDNITLENTSYGDKIQYLKIFAIILFLLLIILIFYYILKNPKVKMNNIDFI